MFINHEVDFARYAYPAGFLDANRQKWWPKEMEFEGIPDFVKPNLVTPDLTFSTLPKNPCKGVKTPVFVKSAAKNNELRNLMRKIFEYQKQESMKMYFILGKGAEEELK